MYMRMNNFMFFISDALQTVDIPTSINASEIGFYFEEFRDTYYMPNEMLANEYPDDLLYLTEKFAAL